MEDFDYISCRECGAKMSCDPYKANSARHSICYKCVKPKYMGEGYRCPRSWVCK